jgi:hypothetical protein
MKFQEYCNDIGDKQKVTMEESLVVTYTNSRDEAFTISPETLKLFFQHLLDNYDNIFQRWALVPSRKKEITEYEEKSYREIYKSADSNKLKTISSAGSSQTKALTQLISKLLAFLTNTKYSGIEVNTLFTKERLAEAISNWESLFFAARPSSSIDKTAHIRERFYLWMINQGLKERTARSYSGPGIDLCDKFINRTSVHKESFYQCSSEEVLKGLSDLQSVPEWSSADKSGNNMYSSACKKLAEYLSSKIHTVRVSKPFMLLAGISGTGKTRFVREQAAATGNLNKTYCLTSVRPDWHEPSDLLGYVSRLNGDPKYVCTDVLQFIVSSWQTIVDSGLFLMEPDLNRQESGISTAGNVTQLNSIPPYWLCLDEMNLAPVEQYFSDYLSVLETRQWSWDGDNFRYICDPLLKSSTIFQVADPNSLRADLGLADSTYDNLWSLFCQYGIGIPFNLIVAGTVNMDETTHGFSRKVIDRALSFDFGEFFPNKFDEYFSPATSHKVFTYPIWSQAELTFLPAIDQDGQKSIKFLRAINEILDQSPFQLAFRALNELLLSVISMEPKDDTELKAIWDDFLMCKILPRIEGDIDKLGTDSAEHTILQKLEGFLQLEFDQFWAGPDNSSESRPDLYRETTDVGDTIHIECRSKRKIQWMQTRLEKSGFTSFWP